MKRSIRTLLSFMIVLSILSVGMGFDVVRCSCTGFSQVVHCGEDMGDHGCDPDEDCETIEHVQLSPSDVMDTVHYDFHLEQLLHAAVPLLIITTKKLNEFYSADHHTQLVSPYPPRLYLHFIRILLI